VVNALTSTLDIPRVRTFLWAAFLNVLASPDSSLSELSDIISTLLGDLAQLYTRIFHKNPVPDQALNILDIV